MGLLRTAIRLICFGSVLHPLTIAVAQTPITEPPAQPTAPTPPAFGPGSPTYGQPFFYEPGSDQKQAVPVQPPKIETIQPPQVDLPRQPNATAPMRLPQVNEDRAWTAPLNAPGEPLVFGSDSMWRFHFQNAPWGVVLRNFARFSNLALILEQEPTGTFSYYDERSYSVIDALDILNDHLLRQGSLLVRNENKLTLVTSTNGLRDGIVPFVPLRAIPTLGRNELVTVAFPIRAGAGQQVVAEVQQLISPLGTVMPLSNSGRIIVTDTGASLRRLKDLMSGSGLAATEVERYVIRLRNSKAQEIATAINQRLGSGGGSAGNSEGIQLASAGAAGGFASSTSTGAGMGQIAVVPEPQTNTLLVEGTPEELAQIESLIRELDHDPGQVIIQALLVEVVLGNTNEFGVELGFQDSVLFDRSVIDNIVSITQTTTAPNGVQTTNQNVVSQTAAPGFNFNGAPLGNNVAVRPSTIGSQGVSNLGLGRVSGDLGFGGLVLSAGSESVNVLLRALAEKHKVDVLSRPHIRAVNNTEALIQIGQQVPVVDGVTVSPNGLANPIVRQDKAGIILRVTPRIADNGTVQIDVQAEKSAYQLVPGSGVPIFTDANTGNVIEAPVKDITTAETTVTAFSEQTIVLGGLITRDDSVVERKVPWLGDIPILGRLFRIDLQRSSRKELLIFLTPTIVRDPYTSDMITQREASRISLNPNECIDLHQDFMRGLSAGQPTPFVTGELPPVLPLIEQ